MDQNQPKTQNQLPIQPDDLHSLEERITLLEENQQNQQASIDVLIRKFD